MNSAYTQKKGKRSPCFLQDAGVLELTFLVRQLNKLWQIQLYNETDPKAFQEWRLRDFNTIEKLVEKSYAPVVLFKPINDTYRMTELLSRFNSSKIIFQFRHYNDVTNSIIRGPFGSRKQLVKEWIDTDFSEFSRYPPHRNTKELIRSLYKDSLNDESGSVLYWLLQNRFLLDQNLLQEARVILVQYEHLVKNTENTLNQIYDFINITNTKRDLAGVRSTSINKNQVPDIEPEILSECESLWNILTKTVSRTEPALK